jgi:hypothetical protein
VLLDVLDPDGNPAVGQILEGEASALPDSPNAPAPQRFAFAENPARPAGTYDALVQAPASWSRAQILAAVPDPFAVPLPGGMGTALGLVVVHDTPGQLRGPFLESAPPSMMTLDVNLTAPADVTLQVDVSKVDGTWVAQWNASARRQPLQQPFTVPLSPALTDLAKDGNLVVSRAALVVDGACSDLLRGKQVASP